MDEILDRAGRALNNAHAALLALFVVDDSEVVFDVDRVEFTGSLAHAAADAGDGAVLAGIRTLLGVVAADKDFCLIVGNDLDQAVGAGLDAGAAAGALVAVYYSDTLDDVNSVKFAGSFAVAQSQTSVGAGLGAAEELLGSLTGRDIRTMPSALLPRIAASFSAQAGPPTAHLVQGTPSGSSTRACA